jgi:hypothetical protein
MRNSHIPLDDRQVNAPRVIPLGLELPNKFFKLSVKPARLGEQQHFRAPRYPTKETRSVARYILDIRTDQIFIDFGTPPQYF